MKTIRIPASELRIGDVITETEGRYQKDTQVYRLAFCNRTGSIHVNLIHKKIWNSVNHGLCYDRIAMVEIKA